MPKLGVFALACCVLASAAPLARQQTTSPVTQPERVSKRPAIRPYRAVHVLSIGINSYASPQSGGSGYPNLQLAEADATAVAAVFRERYQYQVAELLGAKATKPAILNAISQYSQSLGEDDILIIFFAGHGDSVGPDTDTHGFLIPAGTRLDVKKRADVKQWTDDAIDMREVGAMVNAMKARHVLLLADACYSGFFGSRSGGISGRFDLDLLLTGKSRLALTAGTREQKALEASGMSNSLFTTTLLKSLKATSPFSARELALDVRRGVMDLSKGAMQPLLRELVPNWYGEFVFLPKVGLFQSIEDVADQIRGVFRSRGGLATTPTDVYAAIAAEDYRYSAQPEVENAKWQERVGRFQDNATLGDPLAMAGLSIALTKGLGTARNPDEARRWGFESAYSERHPAGLFALAEIYEEGIGVEKNGIAAERLRSESAEGGFPPAMADIARATLKNSGSTTSQKIGAIATLEKAAAAGFVGAKADLGTVYSGTVAGLPADPQRAFEMTRAAAEDGIPSAMTNMFRMYMAGFPPVVQANAGTARDWLVKAAEHGILARASVSRSRVLPEGRLQLRSSRTSTELLNRTEVERTRSTSG